MTPLTEIDLLRDLFTRQTDRLQDEIRELRKETAREHRMQREAIRTVALRVNDLERDDIADDAREEGRREFKASVVRAVVFVNGAALLVLTGLGVLLPLLLNH